MPETRYLDRKRFVLRDGLVTEWNGIADVLAGDAYHLTLKPEERLSRRGRQDALVELDILLSKTYEHAQLPERSELTRHLQKLATNQSGVAGHMAGLLPGTRELVNRADDIETSHEVSHASVASYFVEHATDSDPAQVPCGDALATHLSLSAVLKEIVPMVSTLHDAETTLAADIGLVEERLMAMKNFEEALYRTVHRMVINLHETARSSDVARRAISHEADEVRRGVQVLRDATKEFANRMAVSPVKNNP